MLSLPQVKPLKMDGDTLSNLRKRIDYDQPDELRHAIRCDLPVKSTETLLVVDQFEELFTQRHENIPRDFIKLLMALIGTRCAFGYSRADNNACGLFQSFAATRISG